MAMAFCAPEVRDVARHASVISRVNTRREQQELHIEGRGSFQERDWPIVLIVRVFARALLKIGKKREEHGMQFGDAPVWVGHIVQECVIMEEILSGDVDGDDDVDGVVAVRSKDTDNRRYGH